MRTGRPKGGLCSKGHNLQETRVVYKLKSGKAQSHCGVCSRERQRGNQRKRRYGASVELVESLLEAQHGVCAGCFKPNWGPSGTPSVDHCHATGRIRGLLCFNCNTVLGKVNDDPVVLGNLIMYLRRA